MEISRIVNGVIGLAGHIDHGKSALVHRLTGIDPDRLKEEKERAMTTDLGFASFLLPCGKRVGFIDVPGHDRFVKNMIAGTAGISGVILVVAGDDGVMPQTREHLRILELLGVREGIVAVTKTDLVDGEILDLVREDVADLVRGTFLENRPLVPVSVVTGEGIRDLERSIEAMAVRFNGEDRKDLIFRMPVQRAFSAKGHGTIVTGVPLSGTIRRGETLVVADTGVRVKVRCITAYHEEIPTARGRHSIGLNLTRVEPGQVTRGCTVAHPGYLVPSAFLEVRFRCLPEVVGPLPKVVDIHFHQGTRKADGTLVLLDRNSVEPGAEALAQIRLAEPACIAPGDRFIVRRPAPPKTLGGGMVLSVAGKKLKGRRWRSLGLEAREKLLGRPEEFVEHVVNTGGRDPVPVESMKRETLLLPPALRSVLGALESKGKIRALNGGKWCIGSEALERMGREFLHRLRRHFDDHPLEAWIEKRELESFLPWDRRVFDSIVKSLDLDRVIDVDRGRVRMVPDRTEDGAGAGPIEGAVEKYLRGEGFRIAKVEDLACALGADPKEVMEAVSLLVRAGNLIPLEKKGFAHVDEIAKARRRLLDYFLENPGKKIGFAAFKTRISASCTQADALLEYFFREERLLTRVGSLFAPAPGADRESGKTR